MAEIHNAFGYCRGQLLDRLKEPARGRAQLLTGPVRSTTLLLEIAAQFRNRAVYAAGDEPDAALPGFGERRWAETEERAKGGTAVLLLDEVHHLSAGPLSRSSSRQLGTKNSPGVTKSRA